MMGKLRDTQNRIEETKKRLDSVIIEEQSNDGLIKIGISANSTIKSIVINDTLLADKEQLEDYLIVTINKAIQNAAAVNQVELDAVAKVDMPMIPGMENMFK